MPKDIKAAMGAVKACRRLFTYIRLFGDYRRCSRRSICGSGAQVSVRRRRARAVQEPRGDGP